MRKRICTLLLAVVCLVCGLPAAGQAEIAKRTMFFFDTFDTMVTIIGYTEDQATFDSVTKQAQERFTELHQIFDAYHEYDNIANIYTLNRQAKDAPVPVSAELMQLLSFAGEWQPKLNQQMNIALGSVLSIWHEHRAQGIASPEEAKLPPLDSLKAAMAHTDFSKVILDTEAQTVFFADPDLQLDVGSIAKGFAVELVAQMLLASDMPHFMINAGGNVRAGLPPLDGRTNWGVSIQNPDASFGGSSEPIAVLYLSELSVVTSGDYERFYVVDGVRYHHIISPQTLMPATENRAVTIVTENSGLADVLSTVLFILPHEEGLALVERIGGVEALWVRQDGEVLMTEGMLRMSKSGGATNTPK